MLPYKPNLMFQCPNCRTIQRFYMDTTQQTCFECNEVILNDKFNIPEPILDAIELDVESHQK